MAFSSSSLGDFYRLSSQRNFKDLVELARSLKSLYAPLKVEYMPRPQKVCQARIDKVCQARIDKVAENLVPSHYAQDNVKPILTKGDGNCLFNAASLALCNSEKLSADLHVRTAIELATNLQYYKNHPALAKSGLKRRNGEPWDISSVYYATIFDVSSSKVFLTNSCYSRRAHENLTKRILLWFSSDNGSRFCNWM